ncbi:MAG: hypothetical protein J6X30_00610 [Clostridia bacterium]|nr:hypothetical protein [Clostridia bacterium]
MPLFFKFFRGWIVESPNPISALHISPMSNRKKRTPQTDGLKRSAHLFDIARIDMLKKHESKSEKANPFPNNGFHDSERPRKTP